MKNSENDGCQGSRARERNPAGRQELIGPKDIEVFCQALSRGLSAADAAALAGWSKEGIRKFLHRHPEYGPQVRRARAEWSLFHLGRLALEDDNGPGASSRTRASLAALASVDKRFQPRVLARETHNTLIAVADPRPSSLAGTPGDPARFALPRPEGEESPEPVDIEAESSARTVPEETVPTPCPTEVEPIL